MRSVQEVYILKHNTVAFCTEWLSIYSNQLLKVGHMQFAFQQQDQLLT